MRDLTLTDFLLARIAEDEAVAHGSSAAGPWRHDPTKVNSVNGCEAVFAGPRGAMAITIATTGPADDPQSIRDARHIARHDPARVLAECEAKRRIVEWHANWPVLVETPPRYESGVDATSMTMRVTQQIAWATEQEYRERFGSEPPTGPVLRLLALPYADHLDYRDEWRP